MDKLSGFDKWKLALNSRMVRDSGEYAPMNNAAAVEPVPLNGMALVGHTLAQSMLATMDVIKEKLQEKDPKLSQ